ncbi:MAG: Crp/Fnr family transcriptional regulator [Bacteroidales bacterium]
MESKDLPFFCTMMCSNHSAEKVERSACTIPHILKQFKKGARIASQGDKVLQLMILIKGKVKVDMVTSSGFAMPLEELQAPQPLASAFLFADDNHLPMDIVAKKDCEVLFIAKEAFENQMRHCSNFMRGVMAFNANRMQHISDRLKIFAQKGIKAKMVYYILSREINGNFDLGQSIASLSKYFGVERSSLSRAISEMVNDGLISFQLRKGKIINFTALEELLVKG